VNRRSSELGIWLRHRREAPPSVTSGDSSRRDPERGVTLVELLIAIALLGFILLGIAPLFIASVKSNYSANEYTSLNNLARDRLEQLMTLPFDDPQLSPGSHSVNDLSATLPDPQTGVPPSNVPNPFQRTYWVRQFAIPASGVVPQNGPFTPVLITSAGSVYHYKRIDVTVDTIRPHLGFGARAARVSGILANPSPDANLSVADPDS
jgi:prepilin-type N-terminal cleavage/methylation domain-containing protein